MGAGFVPRILAGVCEHAHSEAAVRRAAEWAEEVRGEVVAVHIRRLMPWTLCPYESAGLTQDWQDACERLALDVALGVLVDGPVPWRVVSRPGGVAQGLAAEALARHALGVVVGQPASRGGRPPWGSVARTLRRLSPAPVLAVSEPPTAPPRADGRPARGVAGWSRLRARFGPAVAAPLADLDPELLAAMSRQERRDTARALRSLRSAALR